MFKKNHNRLLQCFNFYALKKNDYRKLTCFI